MEVPKVFREAAGAPPWTPCRPAGPSPPALLRQPKQAGRGESCGAHHIVSRGKLRSAEWKRVPSNGANMTSNAMYRFFLWFVAASVALVVACVLGATASDSTIRFEAVTAHSKLDFTADSCPTPNKNQPETMVAGVGLIDYDNDGYLDIYLANGAALPSLRKESDKYKNRLFHNNHDGTFTDVTDKAAVAGDGYDMGEAIGDYDNDGWQDIYVASVTGNHLYQDRKSTRLNSSHLGISDAVFCLKQKMEDPP